MLQVWYSPDEEERPSEAVKSGADVSVCGDCAHRPSVARERGVKECYVQTGRAPNMIYATDYPDVEPVSRGVPVRLGAWGEPTSIPYETTLAIAPGQHTGYTHRWRVCDQRYRELLMASVDSEEEQAEAVAMGWRTFRVRRATDALLPGEITCPASKEAGHVTNCAKCLLCAGTSRQAKNIAIIAH